MAISFLLPDGKYLSKTSISTTRESRFLTGKYDEANTVNLEVSVRGQAFVSDPDLISFTAGGFIIPNPEAYPDGLELFPGSNLVQVQATDLKGRISDEGQVDLILVGEDVVEEYPNPPTGITVESFRGSIKLKIIGPENRDSLLGFNVYAAVASGGGDVGYSQVNLNLISDPEVFRSEESLAEMDVDLEVARDEDGNLLRNPQVLQIIAQQTDYGTQEVLKREIDEALVVDELMDKLRLNMVVSQYYRTNTYYFEHNRAAGALSTPPTISNNDFSSLEPTDPLYYVVTAVYRNTNGVEVESVYSVEVEARPQPIMAQTGSFPQVTKNDILASMSTDIYQAHPDIAIHPGTVLRDVIVDPIINEHDRIRLIVDFLHRASSFHTLMRVDDPNNVGESIAVSDSPYKVALANAFHVGNPSTVQQLIDGCYDKLAGNYGLVRQRGKKARGEVTFFVSTLEKTINIPLGTRVSGAFLTTSAVSIPFENGAAYYNPTTKTYQVSVGVIAINAGAAGNRNSGALSSTNIQDVKVRNDAPTFGGSDGETNFQLANRALVKIASVDTGTERGYYQAVAGTPGVEEALCISAGSSLMRRDFDEDYGKHLGGKVDVWIRGDTTTEIFDTFAFTFETKQDVQFELVHLDSLTFRILDPNLSLENPVMELLDYENPKLGLLNASTGEYFDLTGVEIVDYHVIRLNVNIPQPSVDYQDVVLGDYRYRTGSKYYLSRQPVSEIRSMTGTVVGNLDESTFVLTRTHPPTTLGFSAEAQDYVQVITPTVADPNIVSPTGELIEVTNESHVLVGEYLEYLSNLGAVNLTISVTSADGLTEYRGPYHPSGIYDYTIIEGDQTTPVAIKRIEGRDIADGSTVLISYKHDENFTVRYSSNLVVTSTQESIDKMKHLAADVLIKEAIPIPVDITATVVAKRGFSAPEIDATVRISIANLFASLRMGDAVRQSDVVEAIDSAEGVSFVILPMTKMALSDGSYIVQEELASDQAQDHSLLLEWSTPRASAFLLHETLNHNTTSTGGKEYGNFRSVEIDGFVTDLMDHAPQLVGSHPNQSYIIGSSGLPIPNYSDDETIRAQGYVTSDEIRRRRAELSGNKVLVSLPVGESPVDHKFCVTYAASGDDGTNDLECSPSSYFVVGEVTLAFDEDRSNQPMRRSTAGGGGGYSRGSGGY